MSQKHDIEIAIFITAPGEDEAVRIARALVKEKLVACVNIIRDIRSIYRWQGKIEEDTEVLMIAKTQERLIDPVSARVKELHSYDVPEIIAVPITGGSEDYLKWLRESTRL